MKIGDYIRTDKGNISKIKWISEQVTTLNEIKAGTYHLESGEIVHQYYGDTINSSSNILDLIEIGDYVNGLPVINIVEDGVITLALFFKIAKENIKTIVTKEQFKEKEYEV